MEFSARIQAFLILSVGLSVALNLPPALLAGDPPAASRVLRVKAVADEAFREEKKWEKEIREHFEWADEEFRKFAGIGLELVGVDRWTTHESDSMSLLLEELRHRIDKGDADIVVGFTGHKPVELSLISTGAPDWADPESIGAPASITIQLPHIMGIALPLGDRAVIRRSEDKRDTRHTLLHEIAHLFGGLHVKEKSILYATGRRTDFVLDPFNQRVFALTRGRDFNRDPYDFSQEEINRLIPLYRQAPLQDERDFDTHIRIGYLLLAAGEVDPAIEEFEKATAIDPRETLNIIRGAIVPELESYAEEHGATVRTRYTLGRAYATMHEWQKAARHLAANCQANPPHAASCAELGAVLIQGKNVQGAERALRWALQLDESLVNAHVNLGILYSAAGRPAQALAHLNRALELRPDKIDVHYNMGVAYLHLELWEPAADSFRRVLELKPGNDAARVRLALTLARQGEAKQARKLIREFEKRKQLPALIIRDMAEIYFRSGDSKRAWKFLAFAKKGGLNVTELEQEMLAGTPKPRRVKTSDLVQQAAAYYQNKRYEQAHTLLEQARTQAPNNEQVHYWLGRVARARKQPEAAAQHLEQALRLNGNFADAYLELGRLAYDRQEYEAAIGHLNQYVETDPYPISEAYYLLGSSHFERGDLHAALEKLKKSVQQNPDYGDAFYLLAKVYQQQDHFEDAIAELNLAVNSRWLSSSWRPEAHYTLAALCYQTGKYEQAWRHARIARQYGHAEAAALLDDLAREAPEAGVAQGSQPPQD